MKDFAYYSTPPIPYPNKRDYITLYAYDNGMCLYRGNDYTRKQLEDTHSTAVVQEVFEKLLYKADLERYNECIQELTDEFKKDLFEEFGVTDNPKRERAYAYAWDKGHASGLGEVYNEFSDIVELIKD